MQHKYKRTFDAVRMPPERQQQIRSALSSRIAEKQKEDNVVSIKSRRISKAVVIAAVVVLATTLLVGFAYGNQIIQLLGGGRIETGKDSAGNDYISMDSGFASDPAEVRNGQIYFVLDGSDTDITSYCSEETYYQYETIADNGYRHVVIIGGTPDDIGWGEFVWDEKGVFVGSNATQNTPETPKWLENARETFSN